MLPRLKNSSGIILIVVVWILVILTMLVLGLGRRSSLELSMTRQTVGQLRAKYAAVGGLFYSIDKIRQDSEDLASGDTKYRCGFLIPEKKTPADLFKQVSIRDASFDIRFPVIEADGKTRWRYGLEDEEGKINLNALTAENYQVLSSLITLLGFEEDTAETIAASVVDWRDENHDVFDQPRGAENDYYAGLPQPLVCKNQPFDSVEELRMIKGMTPEIFRRIKPWLTVFPKNNRLLINFETADVLVLKALARNMTGAKSNTSIQDADSLADKMVEFRRGEDDQDATEDDRVSESTELNLNAKEMVVFLLMSNNRTKISNYLRLRIRGTDEVTRAVSSIETVVARENLAIVYWHRN